MQCPVCHNFERQSACRPALQLIQCCSWRSTRSALKQQEQPTVFERALIRLRRLMVLRLGLLNFSIFAENSCHNMSRGVETHAKEVDLPLAQLRWMYCVLATWFGGQMRIRRRQLVATQLASSGAERSSFVPSIFFIPFAQTLFSQALPKFLPMRKLVVPGLLLSFLACNLFAQTTPPSSPSSARPQDTSYSVISRDANSATWERTTYS